MSTPGSNAPEEQCVSLDTSGNKEDEATEAENLNFLLNEDDNSKLDSDNETTDDPPAHAEANGVSTNDKEDVDEEDQNDEEDDEEEDEEDDDDDDIEITIGDLKAQTTSFPGSGFNINLKSSRAFATAGASASGSGTQATKSKSSLDVDEVGTYNGVPIFDLNFDTIEDKPWRKPGADITDYFNYGFNEDTWKVYCDRQKKLRGLNSSGMFDVNAVINAALLHPTQAMGQQHPPMDMMGFGGMPPSIPLPPVTGPINEKSKYNGSASIVLTNKPTPHIRHHNDNKDDNDAAIGNVGPNQTISVLGGPNLPVPPLGPPPGFPFQPRDFPGYPPVRPMGDGVGGPNGPNYGLRPMGILPPPPIGPNGQPFFPPPGDMMFGSRPFVPGGGPLIPNPPMMMNQDGGRGSGDRYERSHHRSDFRDRDHERRGGYRRGHRDADYDYDYHRSRSRERERDYYDSRDLRTERRERSTDYYRDDRTKEPDSHYRSIDRSKDFEREERPKDYDYDRERHSAARDREYRSDERRNFALAPVSAPIDDVVSFPVVSSGDHDRKDVKRDDTRDRGGDFERREHKPSHEKVEKPEKRSDKPKELPEPPQPPIASQVKFRASPKTELREDRIASDASGDDAVNIASTVSTTSSTRHSSRKEKEHRDLSKQQRGDRTPEKETKERRDKDKEKEKAKQSDSGDKKEESRKRKYDDKHSHKEREAKRSKHEKKDKDDGDKKDKKHDKKDKDDGEKKEKKERKDKDDKEKSHRHKDKSDKKEKKERKEKKQRDKRRSKD